jgi:predicted O-methyltransferase YrrM
MKDPAVRRHLLFEGLRYKLRLMPRPRYRADTPNTASNDHYGVYFPPTAQTLGAAAMSDEALLFSEDVMEKLTPDEALTLALHFRRWGRGKFGAYWRHADLVSTLWAAATCVRPKTYLEIGVLRGRSAALVGAVCPDVAIYGFDLWIPSYSGIESPGPDFARQEIAKAGHTGQVTLISGDSRKTVPAFLREHPDLYFDIVSIDGDKSIDVAWSDFAATLPRLKVGGIVVSDDLQMFPWLFRPWNRMIENNYRYVTWEFSNGDVGMKAAIRIAV